MEKDDGDWNRGDAGFGIEWKERVFKDGDEIV